MADLQPKTIDDVYDKTEQLRAEIGVLSTKVDEQKIAIPEAVAKKIQENSPPQIA